MKSTLSTLLLVAASCLLLSAAAPSSVVAPRFVVNLDLAPKQRWNEVATKYGDAMKRALEAVKKLVPKEVEEFLSVVGSRLLEAFPHPYNEEMAGMAEVLEVPVEDVVLCNIVYEITAYSGEDFKACTSIVATANSSTIHGRNLDYSLGDILRNTTITVDFQKGGKTVYTGSTNAGMVGLATGQKPNAYTISLDERDKGKLWMNVLEAFTNGMTAAVFLHIRDALANEEFDYEEAVVFLSGKPLIAPCYIIVGGTGPSQGAVITRDRASTLDFMKIHPERGEWYVLETNYDHWTTPPASDDRRDPAIKCMNEMGQDKVSADGLFNVLSTPPVLNDGTVYTTIMSAAQPELYNTWIRNP